MSSKSHPSHVLCLSRDSNLLGTRRMVLESRYEVVAAPCLEELQEVTTDHDFDVILLCHTLSSEDCDLATSIARVRWPNAKIVALSVERSSLRTIDNLMPAQH
jgi:hypothetical protein